MLFRLYNITNSTSQLISTVASWLINHLPMKLTPVGVVSCQQNVSNGLCAKRKQSATLFYASSIGGVDSETTS